MAFPQLWQMPVKSLREPDLMHLMLHFSTEMVSHHLGWVKPLDKKLVGWLASDHRAVITIEEQRSSRPFVC